MEQTDRSTAQGIAMPEAFPFNEDLVYGALGLSPQNCPAATGLVSAVQVEALYDLASRLYAAGEYKDADILFQMLCCYKNDDTRFWMGLGGCRQAAGKPQSAAEAYMATACLQDFRSPQPLLFAALCLLRVNAREAALHLLHGITQMDESNAPANRECTAKAQELLHALRTEMQKEQ